MTDMQTLLCNCGTELHCSIHEPMNDEEFYDPTRLWALFYRTLDKYLKKRYKTKYEKGTKK